MVSELMRLSGKPLPQRVDVGGELGADMPSATTTSNAADTR